MLDFLFRDRTHFEQAGDQGGPAGLVAGPKTTTIVAVKEFVKKDQVLPMRVVGEIAIASVAGAAATPGADVTRLAFRQEDSREPVSQLAGDFG